MYVYPESFTEVGQGVSKILGKSSYHFWEMFGQFASPDGRRKTTQH